jgi:VWFA-related protein
MFASSPALVVVLGGALLAAPQTPVFRSQANYVEIDAVVTDSAGEFVPGLAASDFVVRENTSSQSISAFSYVDLTGPTSGRSRPIAFRGDLSGRERTDAARIYLLYFAAAPEDLARAKDQARTFVVTALQPGDIAMLWQPRALSPMLVTSDKAELLRQINSYSEGRSTQAASAGAMRPAELRQALDWMGGIQGRRKSILLFASGALSATALPSWRGNTLRWLTGEPASPDGTVAARVTLGDPNLSESSDDLGDLIARADVSVYPCDVRGLLAPDHSAGVYELSFYDPTLAAAQRLSQSYDGIARSTDGLLEIAHRTGGLAIVNTNDPVPGFKRIIDDNSHYYLLGYESSAKRVAGEFRRLDVRVNRPGLTVRSRQGYITR